MRTAVVLQLLAVALVACPGCAVYVGAPKLNVPAVTPPNVVIEGPLDDQDLGPAMASRALDVPVSPRDEQGSSECFAKGVPPASIAVSVHATVRSLLRTLAAVFRVPVAGGPVQTLVQLPDGMMSPALAVDGDKLYLGSPSSGVLLGVIPKSGGALTDLASEPDNKGAYVTQSIAITPAHVWVAFADTSSRTCMFNSCPGAPEDTELLRYTKSDGSRFFDASKLDPVVVAAQDGFVYFDSDFNLVRMPDKGGNPERITDAVAYLQLDGRSLFWADDSTDQAPASVGRLDLVSGDMHRYAVGEFHPSALAVDASHVYWEADGNVYRAAR